MIENIIWVVVYLCNLLLLSFGLGCFTFSQRRWLLVSGLPRFLIGFCLAPFAIGVITLGLTTSFPAANKWVFVITPFVFSIGLIIYFLPRNYPVFQTFVANGMQRLLPDLMKKTTLIGSLVVSIVSVIGYVLSIFLAEKILNFLEQLFEQIYFGTGYSWIGSFISFKFPPGVYINLINNKYFQIQSMVLFFTIIVVIFSIFLIAVKASSKWDSYSNQPSYFATIPFWPEKWIYINASVLILFLFSIIVADISVPLMDADARAYMAKGLLLAQSQLLPMSSDFSGTPGGILRDDSHGVMFPAYLSQALMTNGNNPLGYPYDHAARFAFKIPFIYMLLSLVALTTVFRPFKESPFVLLLLLQTPYFFAIVTKPYRDGFRLIPLILLAAVLMGLSPENLRGKKFHPQILIFPMVLAIFCLFGHTLNGFVVVCIVLAWFVWGSLGKTSWTHRFWIPGAVGLGLILGGIRYIVAYIQTGLVFGYLFGPPASYGKIQAGPTSSGFEPSGVVIEKFADAYKGITSISASSGLIGLLERDHFLLSIPGLLSAALLIRLWILRKEKRNEYSVPFFLSLIVLFNLLPLLGAFDTKSYQLSESFLANYRYLLYWHPFAAICFSTIAWQFYRKVNIQKDKRLRNLSIITLTLVSSIAALSANLDLWSSWAKNNSDALVVTSTFSPILQAETLLSDGNKLLVNITGDNYYIGNRAISMYTKQTWGAVYPLSVNAYAMSHLLRDQNIGAVVFYEKWIQKTWIDHFLLKYLEDPKNAFLFSRDEYSRVYVLKNNYIQVPNPAEISKSALWRLDTPTLDSKDRRSMEIFRDTKYNAPPSAIHLSAGSITMWVRNSKLTDAQFLPLINVNSDNMFIYSIANTDGYYVCVDYNDTFLGCSPTQKERYRWHNTLNWHNLTFTWRDGEQTLYVDGVLSVYGSQPSINAKTKYINIGYDAQYDTYWQGYVADVVTYDRPLSHVEVTSLLGREIWLK